MDNINATEMLSEENDKEKKETKRSFRDSIYGNIDISLESMDKFIIAMISLLFIAIILGIVT